MFDKDATNRDQIADFSRARGLFGARRAAHRDGTVKGTGLAQTLREARAGGS